MITLRIGTLLQETVAPYSILMITGFNCDDDGLYYTVKYSHSLEDHTLVIEYLEELLSCGSLMVIPCKVDRKPCSMWKLYDTTTNRYRKPRTKPEKDVVYIVNNILENMMEE